MKKVTLFSADIDTKGIVSQLADYKRSLEELKKAQKSLDTTTKAGAEAFVKNQAQIKSIKAESSKYEKALVQLNDSSGIFHIYPIWLLGLVHDPWNWSLKRSGL